MKSTNLSSEELELMSYTDVANLILTENGKKMKIQDLFAKVIKVMKLPDSYFESKIGDFFGLLSTDKRFIMLEKGYWDLRINHSNKIVIDDDEEDEEELLPAEESSIDELEENLDDSINYDDDTVDDDEEDDDLKDLVIMDEPEDQEAL